MAADAGEASQKMLPRPPCCMRSLLLQLLRPAPSIRASSTAAASSPGVRAAAAPPVRVGRKVSVVLLKQLDNLGHAGAEVAVAPGYARNFLVPSGSAVYATPSARAAHAVVLDAAAARASAAAREENLLRGRVAAVRLRFVQATADGVNLYGSVTAGDIVAALAASALRKLALRERSIRMPAGGAFKTVGEHALEIEPRPGVWCALKVDIVSS